MSTLTSLPSSSSSRYISPDVPSTYLRQVIVDLLLKRGFEGAEAGALAEIERLLEHHITNLFEDSVEYAHLTGRQEVNVIDLVSAQEGSGWGVKRLKRESKRKRGKAPQIQYDQISSPPSPDLPNLLLFDDDPQETATESEDRKPDLNSMSGRKRNEKGIKPIYSQDWFPSLPGKWTLLDTSKVDSNNHQPKEEVIHDQPPSQITTALLDFIKLTATERGDIPPELGVVNYSRVQNAGEDANMDKKGIVSGKGMKRKWGVKGVSTRS
ncbi:uncharacterized protein I206_101478 [Kwoniella pini CBS 10737]|uniref:Bromodomain associated domain-containing protein n=1 Tax=Kwoniella pini CBS 10737 TaxID=1296096 RepID=A0A1B9HWI8_9TREE|nr:uncharacterized protein I206_06549 [Kwoniella pini CBS 10737]OCF47645.1 hypothetical protein I206_06549 [Kwoniella pini CBS 10737]